LFPIHTPWTVSQIENETVSDISRESQAVLDSIKENDFHGALAALEKMKGSLYMFPRRIF
jgi:hypothetical protein